VCLCLNGVQCSEPNAGDDGVALRLKRVLQKHGVSDEVRAAEAQVIDTVKHTETKHVSSVAHAASSNPDEERLRQRTFELQHQEIFARERARQHSLREEEFAHEVKIAELERQQDQILRHVRSVEAELNQQQGGEEVQLASSSTGPDSSSSTASIGAPSSSTSIQASSSTTVIVPVESSSTGIAPGGGTGVTATTGASALDSSSGGNSTGGNETESSTAVGKFVPGEIDHDPFAGGQEFHSVGTADNVVWPSPIEDQSDVVDAMDSTQPTGGYYTPEILAPLPETVSSTASSTALFWKKVETTTAIGSTGESLVNWRWKQLLRSKRGHHALTPKDDEVNVFSLLQTDSEEFSPKYLAKEEADLVAQLKKMDKTKPGWL